MRSPVAIQLRHDAAGGKESVPDSIFYRLLLGAVPRRRDFMSKTEQGESLRPPDTAYRRRLHSGISVYIDLDHAIAKTAQLRPRHAAVATLRLREGDQVTMEQTGRDPLHWTLWADAELLLSRVDSIKIVSVAEQRP